MMMFKMMSSLQPPPLALLPCGPMAAPQLMLSNRSARSKNSGMSLPVVPTSFSEDPPSRYDTLDLAQEEHVTNPSPDPHVEAPLAKPRATVETTTTRNPYRINDDLLFNVERGSLEPKGIQPPDNDSIVGCTP